MSKYTTELRYICENKAGLIQSVGDDDIENIIERSREKIFNFQYPIFNETYRPVLETKILRHFYTREIGLETYGLWHLKLRSKMEEIMPYYNKLYVSESYEKLPIEDVDFYEDLMGNKAGNENVSGSNQNAASGNVMEAANDDHTTTENGSYNKHDLERYHDTPQGRLNDLTNSEYLTSMTQNDGSGTHSDTRNVAGTNNRTTNSTENSSGLYDRETSRTSVESETKHVHGKMHSESYNKLMADYRKNLLNIDMLIINELEELFIQLW